MTKDDDFVFWSTSETIGHIFGVKKLFIYFLYHILGHPVYQFLQKPDFSDFTVSGSGLPMGQRFRKYTVCSKKKVTK